MVRLAAGVCTLTPGVRGVRAPFMGELNISGRSCGASSPGLESRGLLSRNLDAPALAAVMGVSAGPLVAATAR